jgi:hypothetical protein
MNATLITIIDALAGARHLSSLPWKKNVPSSLAGLAHSIAESISTGRFCSAQSSASIETADRSLISWPALVLRARRCEKSNVLPRVGTPLVSPAPVPFEKRFWRHNSVAVLRTRAHHGLAFSLATYYLGTDDTVPSELW